MTSIINPSPEDLMDELDAADAAPKRPPSVVERVARAMVVPLGHSPEADWNRVYVGNGLEDRMEDGSLANLCRALARAAIAAMAASEDRPRLPVVTLGEVEKHFDETAITDRLFDAYDGGAKVLNAVAEVLKHGGSSERALDAGGRALSGLRGPAPK